MLKRERAADKGKGRVEGEASSSPGGPAEKAAEETSDRVTASLFDFGKKQLELPIFSGEDPQGWLFWAERYFSMKQINDEEKVAAAVICLEGKALSWYQWIEVRALVITWVTFKTSLLRRFMGSQESNAYVNLVALHQEGIVANYREAFEHVSSSLIDVGEEMLMGTFLNGLTEEIKVEVKFSKPNNLHSLMELAQGIEEKNWAVAKARRIKEWQKFNNSEPGNAKKRNWVWLLKFESRIEKLLFW